jgi:hypothetical protein
MDRIKELGQTTGKAPDGKMVDTDGKTPIDNPQEQEVIRLIKQCKGEGLNLRQTCEKLTEHGYVSRSGKSFLPGSIHQILAKTA